MNKKLSQDAVGSAEAGIAIGPILFIIAVLAVLAAAIAASSNNFTGSTNATSNKVIASTIIQQLSDLDTAVQKIEANGYSHNQISFYTPLSDLNRGADGTDFSSIYQNPACTTDACKVFMPNGGGTVAAPFPVDAFDYTCMDGAHGLLPYCSAANGNSPCRYAFGAAEFAADPYYFVEINISGIGSSSYTRYGISAACIPLELCYEINRQLGLGGTSGVLEPALNGATSITPTLPVVSQAYSFQANFFSGLAGASAGGKKTFCYSGSYSPFAGTLVHQF